MKNNNSVPKADGIKQLRGGGSSGDTGDLKPGDWPIRLRGYYRALKRGKKWAVDLSKLPPVQFVLRWVYGRQLEKLLTERNLFLDLLKIQKNDFYGTYVPVPEEKDDV